jgi:hypothetical protein
MPRKTTTKQKQKQKQEQNVKQTVIIKLDKEGKRIKRRRKRVQKKTPEGESTMYRSLPAPVVYQSSYAIPYPVFKEPAKVATVAPEPKAKPFIEDLGLVGTEGPVTILEKPTKKELLGELIAPVDREKDLGNQFAESEAMAREAQKYWQRKQQEFTLPAVEAIPVLPRTRRTKQQMAEARQMEREDIASINLGLSQFNPLLTNKGIHEGMPKVSESKPLQPESSIPSEFTASFSQPPIYEGLQKMGPAPNAARLPKEVLTETQSVDTSKTTIPTEASLLSEQNIPESVLKPRKYHSGSWANLCLQYEQITGKSISVYRAKKEYGTKEVFAEYIDKLNRQK